MTPQCWCEGGEDDLRDTCRLLRAENTALKAALSELHMRLNLVTEQRDRYRKRASEDPLELARRVDVLVETEVTS